MIAANPRACVQFERNVELVTDPDDPCRWSFNYESVLGFGSIVEIIDERQKHHALNRIMRHYSGRDWSFGETALASTRVWRIDLDGLTGKRSMHKP